MNIRFLLLTTVLALQSAWILGTSLVQERVLRAGQVICLETWPVDPRDLLRGDYVTLNYKISDLDRSLFVPALPNAPTPGQTVYVAMESQGQFYVPVRASLEPITAAGGWVVLRGQVQNRWANPGPQRVHVVYGLEQYFVREGTGAPRGKLTVHAAVPASGRATIKEVFVDGRPYSEAMKDQRR